MLDQETRENYAIVAHAAQDRPDAAKDKCRQVLAMAYLKLLDDFNELVRKHGD